MVDAQTKLSSMTEAYKQGRDAGRKYKYSKFDMKKLNPYKAGTIEAQEWDRGFNHGVRTTSA